MKKIPTKKRVGRPATGLNPKRYYRCSDDQHARHAAAAEAAGVSLSEFTRQALDAAADKVLKRK